VAGTVSCKVCSACPLSAVCLTMQGRVAVCWCSECAKHVVYREDEWSFDFVGDARGVPDGCPGKAGGAGKKVYYPVVPKCGDCHPGWVSVRRERGEVVLDG